jgi:hypothetical protein
MNILMAVFTFTNLSELPVTNKLPVASMSSPFMVPEREASNSLICAPS